MSKGSFYTHGSRFSRGSGSDRLESWDVGRNDDGSQISERTCTPIPARGNQKPQLSAEHLLTSNASDVKRELWLIICNGMIVGSGNDMPTPRTVLDIDILSADLNLDTEPLSFISLGEGVTHQHFMGKVYSVFYECNGHVVPYLVVVKVGKPTERSRPGNRGK